MQEQGLPFLNILSAEGTRERLRIRLLQIILVFFVISGLAFTIPTIANENAIELGVNLVAPIVTIISMVLLWLTTQNRFIHIASTLIIIYIMLIGTFLFVVSGNITFLFLFLALSSLSSAVLSSRLVYWATGIITVVLIIGASVISITNGNEQFFDNSILSIMVTILFGSIPIIIGAIARYFVTALETTASRAQRSASLLAASADIGQNVSEVLSLGELLKRAVNIIRDRFAFYHVSIFLTDSDSRYTHLAASTGEVGEQMLARGHRLLIDANSVVGRSTQSQDIIVVRNVEADSGHSYNELLPDARSELAVPIIDNEGVIGVIDVQSLRTDAFSSTEVEALRIIANQLATAISNTRLFADKENSIRENKRLFIESETNLREIQRLNRQLTKQAWTDYLQTDRRIDGVTLLDDRFSNRADWSEDMITASQKRRAVTEDKDGIRKISVPIELRGEVVGAIELETKQNKNKDDVVDMVRTISQRLGVSLDNARLFEESNEATAQEQRISEIVAQYQSADSVDDLLRLTIQGLAETLGADHASIRLGVVPDISPLNIDDTEIANGDSSI